MNAVNANASVWISLCGCVKKCTKKSFKCARVITLWILFKKNPVSIFSANWWKQYTCNIWSIPCPIFSLQLEGCACYVRHGTLSASWSSFLLLAPWFLSLGLSVCQPQLLILPLFLPLLLLGALHWLLLFFPVCNIWCSGAPPSFTSVPASSSLFPQIHSCLFHPTLCQELC